MTYALDFEDLLGATVLHINKLAAELERMEKEKNPQERQNSSVCGPSQIEGEGAWKKLYKVWGKNQGARTVPSRARGHVRHRPWHCEDEGGGAPIMDHVVNEEPGKEPTGGLHPSKF